MKNITTIILLLINFNLLGQKNDGIITYKKVRIIKTFTKEKEKRLGKEKFKKFTQIEASMNKAYKDLNFTLQYNNEASTFKVQKFLETPKHRFLKFSVGPEGTGIYYNSKTERLRQMNTFGEDFIISYKPSKIQWKLENKSKKIGIYICYKATALETYRSNSGNKTYTITAWYTPEINAPYGPLGFSGLPGLILELNRSKFKYFAETIILNPKKRVEIKKPKKGKKISQEKYLDLIDLSISKFKKIRG